MQVESIRATPVHMCNRNTVAIKSERQKTGGKEGRRREKYDTKSDELEKEANRKCGINREKPKEKCSERDK